MMSDRIDQTSRTSRSELSDLIAELCEVGRDAVSQGLVLASGGNLSARIPGGREFAVTASGTYLDRLTAEDFTVMSLDGTIIGGAHRPSSEWKLHQRTYLAREDVNAVVHVHPQTAVLLDALGKGIRLFTLDHMHYVRSIGRTDFYPNGSDELADTAADQAREHNCVVMAHHGCSAIGPDIAMAYRRALNLEQAAQTTFKALQLGDTTTAFPADKSAEVVHA